RRGVLRLPDSLHGFGFTQNLFQRGGDFGHAFKAGIDVVAFFVVLDIVSTGFDGRFHHGVFRTSAGRIGDFANAIEHEADRTGFAQGATVLGEVGANVRCGAVAVVSQRLHDDSNTTRAVTFVA